MRRNFLLGMLVIAALGLLRNVGTSAAQRIRPPDSIRCPRNNLTSFSGTILLYSRNTGRTEIQMRTDENTTERFVLRHPGSQDPSKWFLLRAGAFKEKDWRVIESAQGRLHANMRASVWVCDDGSNPIVDWQPPQ